MKRTSLFPDPALILFALMATLMGLFFIFDAGYARSIGKESSTIPSEFRNQLIFLLPSIGIGLLCGRLKEATWMKISTGLLIVTVVLLLAVAKFGIRQNGAQRWLGYGVLTVQPAEFAKLACVMYLAGVFAQRKPWPQNMKPRKDWAQWLDTVLIPKFKRILPGLVILGIAKLIDGEKDLGTAGVIVMTAYVMFVCAGVTRTSLIAAVILAVFGSWVLVKQEPYRLERIVNHTQRWSPDNVDDNSFQTVQSELAMASGGIAGVGIGNGRAKQVIPATTTDFIMATVGEEFGLLGVLLVLLALGGVVWRLLENAARAKSRFASLVLYGLAAWIGIQASVNVMMANGLLPAIGIPLPFISSGGSSLMALWCAIGVAQSAIAAPEPKVEEAKQPAPKRAVVRSRTKARPRVSRV